MPLKNSRDPRYDNSKIWEASHKFRGKREPTMAKDLPQYIKAVKKEI